MIKRSVRQKAFPGLPGIICTLAGLSGQPDSALRSAKRSATAAAAAAYRLYRRSLKLALDWSVHRHLWRGQALYIRSLFEANSNVREPRQQRILFDQTEELLKQWKHPDPYRPPTAPGGSKYERNLPCPILEPPPPGC
ncbi:hypothetical protein D6D23_08717 [Aureobasidium pullulans]|nr:hypothetical protein D6D23_08717 [Aureobasidium pullulans]